MKASKETYTKKIAAKIIAAKNIAETKIDPKNIWENVVVHKHQIRQGICVICSVSIAALLTIYIVGQRMELVEAKMSDTQKALAQEVFRLHILANSDSEEDQNVKLAVRDAVIAYMENAEACSTELERAETTGTGALSTELDSAESAKAWACAHLEELEQVADRILAEQGYDYQAKAEVVTCYFPEKEYGDITFPAGNYQALRIKLGKAEGHNWWCVLYPGLCFTSQTCAVVTEEGKESLQKALTEEEYEMVTAATEFKIRWFFFGDAKDK